MMIKGICAECGTIENLNLYLIMLIKVVILVMHY